MDVPVHVNWTHYNLSIFSKTREMGNYTFRKSWSRISKRNIACEGNLVFFDNYENCFDCGTLGPRPRKKFSIHRDRHGKVEDAILMVSGFPESVNLRHKGHKACLFSLTKNNRLLRVDLDSGHLLETVFLGSFSVKYKKIQWNTVGESFAIYSTLFPMHAALRQAGQDVNEVKQLIVMSCMPLDIVCKLSITKKVFGRDVVDAALCLNILMVMHSSNYVRMYSLEQILDMCQQLHHHRLYEELQDGSQYGVHPTPLTWSHTLEESPPCLFEVKCRNRDVMLTMPPCYYVMWPAQDRRGYCCFSFKTRQMVEGGCILAEDNGLEERVSLHADDSGRIVQMTNSELKMLKLVPDTQDPEVKLVEDFVIGFNPKPQVPDLKVTQSGRIIKQRVDTNSHVIPDRTVLTMMYSENLDMIVMMSVSMSTSDSATDCPVVGFYDNWNGKLLRQFELDEPIDDALERSLGFELDTLTHVYKTFKNKYECHVYHLRPLT